MTTSNTVALRDFSLDMQIAKLSPITMRDRLAILGRFARHLDGKPLLAATSDDLRTFQTTFAHLQPSSVNIYSRHLKAFYRWAAKRRLIKVSPAEEMTIPAAPRGLPHPTAAADLSLIFACTTGPLRVAYVLAAFAGLRRGEICSLRAADIDIDNGPVTALIHGKGRRERRVPLLGPVMTELWDAGLRRSGWVLATVDGNPYPPARLSSESTRHLAELGAATTLHSMRHAWATHAARITRDPLLVRDLLGHSSVSTTEIYMGSTVTDAHLRLAQLSTLAEDLLTPRQRMPRTEDVA